MTTVTKLQRWYPDTCRCIIDQMVDYDENGKALAEPRFALMNEVCSKHEHMMSTRYAENHQQLVDNIADLIEKTKARNLKQVDDQIAAAQNAKKGKNRLLRDLNMSRAHILQHNNDITEEWAELTSFPHSFDSHIHDTVVAENRAASAARAAAIERGEIPPPPRGGGRFGPGVQNQMK